MSSISSITRDWADYTSEEESSDDDTYVPAMLKAKKSSKKKVSTFTTWSELTNMKNKDSNIKPIKKENEKIILDDTNAGLNLLFKSLNGKNESKLAVTHKAKELKKNLLHLNKTHGKDGII